MATRIACAVVCASAVLQKFKLDVMISDRLRGWLVSLVSFGAKSIEYRMDRPAKADLTGAAILSVAA
jgi:hypothetical protein